MGIAGYCGSVQGIGQIVLLATVHISSELIALAVCPFRRRKITNAGQVYEDDLFHVSSRSDVDVSSLLWRGLAHDIVRVGKELDEPRAEALKELSFNGLLEVRILSGIKAGAIRGQGEAVGGHACLEPAGHVFGGHGLDETWKNLS